MKMYENICGLYVAKEEKRLAKHIMPEYFVDQNIGTKNIGIEYAIRFLQNQLNEILNSFLNGGFSRKGFVFYPFIKDVSRENMDRMKRLRKIALLLDKNGYDFSGSIRIFNEGISARTFPGIISSLYMDFSKIKNEGNKRVKKPKCGEFGINDCKKDQVFLKPLGDLKDYANEKLRGHLAGFYLHGSLATKDYVKGWSDVDTISIVSRETLENPKMLMELRDHMFRARKFFYQVDPLQHHGSIMIAEYDLKNYCQAYFPVQIFRYSKSFFEDDGEMQFKVRGYSSEALAKIFWFVSYFRAIGMAKIHNLGSHEAKSLLHAVTLFPALYLQARGSLMYKKFSFNKAKRHFGGETWKVIDYVSSLRNNWKGFGAFPLIKSFSDINPLLCYRINAKLMDIFSGISKKNKINTEYISREMLSLSEQAWGKVRENAGKI